MQVKTCSASYRSCYPTRTCSSKWMNEWTKNQTNEQMNGQMDKWTNEQTKGMIGHVHVNKWS